VAHWRRARFSVRSGSGGGCRRRCSGSWSKQRRRRGAHGDDEHDFGGGVVQFALSACRGSAGARSVCGVAGSNSTAWRRASLRGWERRERESGALNSRAWLGREARVCGGRGGSDGVGERRVWGRLLAREGE
jgi:hypothetical protein